MNLKSKIKNGKVAVGTWVTLGHAAIAEIFAKSGCDWVTIDLEHSAIDLNGAQDLIRTVDLCGCAPLVRLSSLDPVQIKRVMDAGAHGVIAPSICTVAQAIELVKAVHYPPKGTRGVGLARAQGYGTTFKDYVSWLKDNSVILVQIEHIDAVRNLESILSVDGIDGFLIGPYDLSASLGRPGDFENPDFKSAMTKISETAQKLNIPYGLHVVEADQGAFQKAINDGMRLVVYSVDIRILDSSLNFLKSR